jgi:hypothetical protein
VAPLVTSPPESLRGAERPRVELRPQTEIAYSLSDEAVELSRRAGLILEPWQRDSLDLMMSVRPDGKWACFEYFECVPRQNGKGAILEARALAGLLLLGEMEILWSAHEYKTAKLGFNRMRRLVRELGVQVDKDGLLWEIGGIRVKIHGTHGEEGFERLDTEARIKFIARSKGSGRGFSGDLIIIDEAFAYTDAMHDALLPTLLARPNGQIVYTSTPPLDSFSGEVMFALQARSLAGGDDGLGYRDWGLGVLLEDRDTIDLDDPKLWARTNPALGHGRVTGETIRKLRRSMRGQGFPREVLCLWPRQNLGGGAIDIKQWADLEDKESRRQGDVAIGVDISPNRDYASVAVYGLRGDGHGHTQIMDYRPGTGWLVERLVELRDTLDPIAFGMGRGTYASLKTDLAEVGIAEPEDPDEPGRGDLAVTNSVEMAAACGQLIDAVRQGTIHHLAEHPLDAAVVGAKTRQTGDTIAWHRQDVTTDIAPLVAVTVARWAYTTRLDAVTADYDVLDSIG